MYRSNTEDLPLWDGESYREPLVRPEDRISNQEWEHLHHLNEMLMEKFEEALDGKHKTSMFPRDMYGEGGFEVWANQWAGTKLPENDQGGEKKELSAHESYENMIKQKRIMLSQFNFETVAMSHYVTNAGYRESCKRALGEREIGSSFRGSAMHAMRKQAEYLSMPCNAEPHMGDDYDNLNPFLLLEGSHESLDVTKLSNI